MSCPVLQLAVWRLLRTPRRDLLVDPALYLNANVESQLFPRQRGAVAGRAEGVLCLGSVCSQGEMPLVGPRW